MPVTVDMTDLSDELNYRINRTADFSSYVDHTPSYYRWLSSDGHRISVSGSGITVDGSNIPTAGTITIITIDLFGDSVAVPDIRITGLNNIDITSFDFSSSLTANETFWQIVLDGQTEIIQSDNFRNEIGGDYMFLGSTDVKTGYSDYFVGADGIDTIAYGDAYFLVSSATLFGGDDRTSGIFDRFYGDVYELRQSSRLFGGNDSISMTLDWTADSSIELAGDFDKAIHSSTAFGGDDIIDARSVTTATAFIYGEGSQIMDSATVSGGDDIIFSGGGNDFLYGDVIVLSGSAPVLYGGDDAVYGGAGNDSIYGDYDANFGGAIRGGNDRLYGEAGDDAIRGNSGNDLLDGGDGNDRLDGGPGDDTLVGGNGLDLTSGGDGNDIHYVANAHDIAWENAGEGSNDRVATAVSYTLDPGAEIELFTTTATSSTRALSLTGNELAQTIVGNSGDNVLSDGGGAGADVLNGYFGNDTYIVRNAATTITEVVGRGTNDRVAAAVDFALAADDDIELLTTTSTAGTAGIDLTGNALAQTIIGNAGSNILRSGTGAPDLLRGLGGNDTYRVFNSGDDIIEVAGQGSFDRVITTVAYALAAGVDVERLQTDSTSGMADFNLIGNEIAQTIIGNAGVNYIRGRGGEDVLYGMLGDDRFVFYAADFASGVNDEIRDFHEATGDTDVLRLQGSAADYAFADVGAILQVTHNASGGTITINNFSQAQLDAAQTSYF